MFVCFFFNHNTAYEMRISDWSSDVCSSDLSSCLPKLTVRRTARPCSNPPKPTERLRCIACVRSVARNISCACTWRPSACPSKTIRCIQCCATIRSEEHTSELQSLMRISYAVFCLKKKNNKKIQKNRQYKQLRR